MGGVGEWVGWKVSGVGCACCREGGNEGNGYEGQDGEWVGSKNGLGGKLNGVGCTCCREGGKGGKLTGKCKGRLIWWDNEWGGLQMGFCGGGRVNGQGSWKGKWVGWENG